MPVTLTYPGVYIEELSSGVHTITGVATSIAAFVGWAPQGPTDRAQLILSWADYERQFGGLDMRSPLGYAVYQFFTNGGQQAYVVRLVARDSPPPAPVVAGFAAKTGATATTDLNGRLTVTAKNEGTWSKNYAIGIQKRPAPDADRFRLTVFNVRPDGTEVPVETFENLSMNPSDPRFVGAVVNNQSALVNAAIVGTPTPPATSLAPPDDIPMPAVPAVDATPAIPAKPSAKLQGGGDGKPLPPNDAAFEAALDLAAGAGGVKFLDRIDLFNLLCVPGESNPTILAALEAFCKARRAFLIADSPSDVTLDTLTATPDTALNGLTGDAATNAALYFPWVLAPDPNQENRLRAFPPSGFMAGVYARTDANRGVWKAPAGTEASLNGAAGVSVQLTDQENGVLNPQAINCIRNFPVYGTIAWGARTLQGNDQVGSEWKYIPIRRLALYIEESLYRGTKWIVFEPNDEPLWSQIRLNVGAFMQDLFRQGAFQGSTPKDAYFVKCDKETTIQNDINLGIVNIVVGFAPLKPAEFVVIKIQQMAGQIAA